MRKEDGASKSWKYKLAAIVAVNAISFSVIYANTRGSDPSSISLRELVAGGYSASKVEVELNDEFGPEFTVLAFNESDRNLNRINTIPPQSSFDVRKLALDSFARLEDLNGRKENLESGTSLYADGSSKGLCAVAYAKFKTLPDIAMLHHELSHCILHTRIASNPDLLKTVYDKAIFKSLFVLSGRPDLYNLLTDKVIEGAHERIQDEVFADVIGFWMLSNKVIHRKFDKILVSAIKLRSKHEALCGSCSAYSSSIPLMALRDLMKSGALKNKDDEMEIFSLVMSKARELGLPPNEFLIFRHLPTYQSNDFGELRPNVGINKTNDGKAFSKKLLITMNSYR